jgi:hypothetical protein
VLWRYCRRTKDEGRRTNEAQLVLLRVGFEFHFISKQDAPTPIIGYGRDLRDALYVLLQVVPLVGDQLKLCLRGVSAGRHTALHWHCVTGTGTVSLHCTGTVSLALALCHWYWHCFTGTVSLVLALFHWYCVTGTGTVSLVLPLVLALWHLHCVTGTGTVTLVLPLVLALWHSSTGTVALALWYWHWHCGTSTVALALKWAPAIP